MKITSLLFNFVYFGLPIKIFAHYDLNYFFLPKIGSYRLPTHRQEIFSMIPSYFKIKGQSELIRSFRSKRVIELNVIFIFNCYTCLFLILHIN